MSSPCQPAPERARKIVQVVLQRLAGGSQAAIAAGMGVSESTISRLKNEHLETFAALLAQAGLKVVPVESVSVDARRLDAMGEIVAAALRKNPNIAALLADDE